MSCGGPLTPLPIRASWVDVASADDVAGSAGVLQLVLSNDLSQDVQDVLIQESHITGDAAGLLIDVEVVEVDDTSLAANGEAAVDVDLLSLGFDVQKIGLSGRIEFEGRIVVGGEAGTPLGTLHSVPVYFHHDADSDEFKVYGEEAMRADFNHGDFG